MSGRRRTCTNARSCLPCARSVAYMYYCDGTSFSGDNPDPVVVQGGKVSSDEAVQPLPVDSAHPAHLPRARALWACGACGRGCGRVGVWACGCGCGCACTPLSVSASALAQPSTHTRRRAGGTQARRPNRPSTLTDHPTPTPRPPTPRPRTLIRAPFAPLPRCRPSTSVANASSTPTSPASCRRAVTHITLHDRAFPCIDVQG